MPGQKLNYNRIIVKYCKTFKINYANYINQLRVVLKLIMLSWKKLESFTFFIGLMPKNETF